MGTSRSPPCHFAETARRQYGWHRTGVSDMSAPFCSCITKRNYAPRHLYVCAYAYVYICMYVWRIDYICRGVSLFIASTAKCISRQAFQSKQWCGTLTTTTSNKSKLCHHVVQHRSRLNMIVSIIYLHKYNIKYNMYVRPSSMIASVSGVRWPVYLHEEIKFHKNGLSIAHLHIFNFLLLFTLFKR